MSSEELAPALHTLADRYEIVREVGRGGMASVFLARELASGRMVAIKTIDARHAEDSEARARFAREARTVASLEHPNIVRTLAVEELADGVAAIIMEYVPGGTLRDLLVSGGPLVFDRAERILREIGEALRYAHRCGLVHRDVKPENVFIDEASGRALLSDFGIARLVEEATRLTLTGTSIGTPTYMSPEQIDGKKLDGRTDIYSLGLVGWETMAGARPWEGESLYKVIYKQKHEELPRLTLLRPGIPENLLFAIEGALHKDRETRWANLDEFLDELSRHDAVAPAAARAAISSAAPAAASQPVEPANVAHAEPEAVAATTSPVAENGDGPSSPSDERTDRLTGVQPADDPHSDVGEWRPTSVGEDPWSEAYVPGTPEEEARRDAEALGRWPSRRWGSWRRSRPAATATDEDVILDDGRDPIAAPIESPRPRSALLVPLALAAVAVVAIAGGVRSRPASVSVPLDSVTQSMSAGELDTTAPVDSNATRSGEPTNTSGPTASRAPGSSLPATDASPGSASDARTRSPAARSTATDVAPRPGRTARGATSPALVAPPPSGATARRPRTHADSLALCSTPGIVEQQACLSASLSDRDRGLNNVYQTLIREMRRQEGVAAGAPDPTSVERLRQQQREWIVARDEACRREASAASSALWAAPRVRCLGREGVVRAGVLADRLTRLRAP